MCPSNYCSQGYNMHHTRLFDNPDEPINTISPTMKIIDPCWNHHLVLLNLRIKYPLFSLLAPFRKGRYCFPGWQALLKLDDLIWWSSTEVYYRKRRNSSMEGVIEGILFTLHILDPDVISFRPGPLVGISIFYLAIKSLMLNRYRAVKWLTVIQQPILECITYTVSQ